MAISTRLTSAAGMAFRRSGSARASGGEGGGGGGWAGGDLLIETEAAAKLLGQPNVRLIDAADAASYQRAHIPGAVNIFYLDVAKLDSRKKNGHPLSEAAPAKIYGA